VTATPGGATQFSVMENDWAIAVKALGGAMLGEAEGLAAPVDFLLPRRRSPPPR
jgi:hypothetical protein